MNRIERIGATAAIVMLLAYALISSGCGTVQPLEVPGSSNSVVSVEQVVTELKSFTSEAGLELEMNRTRLARGGRAKVVSGTAADKYGSEVDFEFAVFPDRKAANKFGATVLPFFDLRDWSSGDHVDESEPNAGFVGVIGNVAPALYWRKIVGTKRPVSAPVPTYVLTDALIASFPEDDASITAFKGIRPQSGAASLR